MLSKTAKGEGIIFNFYTKIYVQEFMLKKNKKYFYMEE